MKKLFCLLLMICTANIAYSSRFSFDYSTCSTAECPDGTLLGDDGQCHTCDEKEAIGVMCMIEQKSYELAKQTCPNRILVGQIGGQYEVSIFCPENSCPSGTFRGDNGNCYSCDETVDIPIKCLIMRKDKPSHSEICPNRRLIEGFESYYSRFCPKNNCPLLTFMGDDGYCYSCNEEKEIKVNCAGGQFWRCPNRRYYTDENGSHKSYKCSLNPFSENFCCFGNDCHSDEVPIIWY